MSIVRDTAATLVKMFAGDIPVTIGVLIVVALAGTLTRYSASPGLSGAVLLLGTVVVLALSVALAAVRRRGREAGQAAGTPRN